MRKLILSLALLLVGGACFAQSLVMFKLTTSGSFASEEGRDFVVVPFEGKNAHQLFNFFVQMQTNCTRILKRLCLLSTTHRSLLEPMIPK